MTSLETSFKQFAEKYPTPASHPNGPTSNGDTTWDQDCAAFIYRFGMYVVGATAWTRACKVFGPTAWDVALASGPRNGVASAAPAGAIHWWSTSGGKPGHVAVDLTGGGTRLAMASYAVTTALAPALGYQSVAGYSKARPATKYVGWTDNYGGARYPISAPAGGDTAPFTRRKPMFSFVKDPNSSTIWVASTITGLRVGIKGPGDYHLLKAFSDGVDGDPLNTLKPALSAAQMDVVRGYLQLLNPPVGLDVPALVAALDAANDDETAAILTEIGKMTPSDPQVVAAAAMAGAKEALADLTLVVKQ